MFSSDEKYLDAKAIPYWRSTGCIAALFYICAPVAYGVMAAIWNWPKWIIFVLAFFALGLSLLRIIWLPAWRWRRWRYKVTEHEIAISRGILFYTHTLIPMVKVQHVDSEQGPMLRRLSLSSVTISTAAGTHEIPALDQEEAIGLRNRIAELARVVEEDV